MQNEISEWPLKTVLKALENNRVQYILIGGQAVVAYGASQFTRDADIWINPTRKNIEAFKKAMDSINAKPRFLPPLELNFLKKGHGVHFKFNFKGREFLIDVLGKPPRVSGFSDAYKETQKIKWHDQVVPVVDIKRLVNTKKTNREKDYLVIENLTTAVYGTALNDKNLRSSVTPWLLEEGRNPLQLITMIKKWNGVKSLARKSKRPAVIAAVKGKSAREIQIALDKEKEFLKQENLKYWRPFISELRDIKKQKNGN